MKKLLFLFFIPFFLLVSCVHNIAEPKSKNGNIEITNECFRVVRDLVPKNSQLSKESINVQFLLNDGNEKKVKSISKDTTIDDLLSSPENITFVPYADNYKLTINVSYKDVLIFTASSTFDFQIQPDDNPNMTVDILLEPVEYTISFLDNIYPSITYTVGQEILLPTISQDKKKFLGWKTKEGKNFTTIGKQNTVGDIELIPLFEDAKYKITYFSDDKIVKSNFVSDNYLITKEDLLPIEKEGFTFDGWFDETNIKVNDNYLISENTILRAKYTAITYTITYNNNENINTVPNNTIETDILLSDPLPREGYSFRGWYTTDNFIENTRITRISNRFEDITLYANWELTNYTITYENSNIPPSSYTLSDKSISLPTPEKVGYTFDGWFLDSKLTTNKVTEIASNTTGNLILYAKWSVNSVTFETDDPDYNTGAKITLKTSTPNSKIYYTLDETDPLISHTKKLYDASSPIILNQDKLIIKAYAISDTFKPSKSTSITITRKLYSVIFLTEHGFGSIETQKLPFGSKVTRRTPMNANGYRCTGWVRQDKPGEVFWNFDTDTVGKENLVLRAKWVPKEYKINFKANNVPNLTDVSKTYQFDKSFLTPSNSLSRIGYTFSWNSNPKGTGDVYNENTIYSIQELFKNGKFDENQQLTLYAQYKPIAYQVYLDEDPTTTEQNPQYKTYKYDEVITLPTNVTKSGYKFDNLWKEKNTGKLYNSGDRIKNLTSTEGEKITLTAQFTDVPPSNVTNLVFTQVKDDVEITWKDPEDADLFNIIITYSPDTPPIATQVSKGTQKAIIKGLKNNINYVFTITCSDKASNTSTDLQYNYYGLNQIVRELPAGTSGTVGNAGTDGPDPDTANKKIRYVIFGDWPQTRKVESVKIIDESKPTTQINGWDCYLGDDNCYYVKEKVEEDPKYNFDITYGPKFPDETDPVKGQYYYFKIEPVKWRILDTKYGGEGNYLLLSEKLHYCGPYSVINNQDYATSDMRKSFNGLDGYSIFNKNNEIYKPSMLLNGFTTDARKIINDTNLTDVNTTDNIFALSKTELNSYGLDNPDNNAWAQTPQRHCARTDYAAIKGAKWDVDWVTDKSCSVVEGEYWTRTAVTKDDTAVEQTQDITHEMHYVTVTGKLGGATRTANTYYTCYRPALVVSSASVIPAQAQ